MAVTGGDEFDVIYIEQDTINYPSRLRYDSMNVPMKVSSAEETFDPVYYNGVNIVSPEFS